jgi:hypothetical protein
MSRPYPHRQRRRPGHRLFNVRRVSRPRGFTRPGFKPFWNAILPLHGSERRRFFNEVSHWMVLGFGVGGALLGLSWAGLLGVFLGFGLGITGGGYLVEKGGFSRR